MQVAPAKSAERGAVWRWLEGMSSVLVAECITWPFYREANGYGALRREGKKTWAHRAMCELKNGPPPFSEAVVAHSCGNGDKGCVNPNHLRWDTRAGNMKDMLVHGTAGRGGAAGEGNGNAKLSDREADEIRSSKDKSGVLATKYGVDRTTIWLIRSGRTRA